MKSKLGDYTGALKDYSKAIKLNPKDVDAYKNRGYAKFKLNDYTGTVKDCDKSILLNTKYAPAYFIRGLAKDKLKNKKAALSDLSMAGELGYEKAYEVIKEIQVE